jgi:hypothetical protein
MKQPAQQVRTGLLAHVPAHRLDSLRSVGTEFKVMQELLYRMTV